MSEAVITALITAGVTLIGVLVNARVQHTKYMAELDKHQAVTETKLDDLTREVRSHNEFARRMPVVEEQIKVANHRIEDLERKVGM